MITNIVLADCCRAWSSWPVAPFFSGLGRVIRAKMHNRRGPSIMQDYRDLAKLFARPESQSEDCELCAAHHAAAVLRRRRLCSRWVCRIFTAQSPMPGLW